MKVIRLKTNPDIYSGNSYLILGTWNKLSDRNTIIDTGSDGYIINELENINTGLGKKKVEQVILTHSHFDHIGGVKSLKEKYDPFVFASTVFDKVDRVLNENESVLIGDTYFDVICTPCHSSDSICLYCKSERIIFTGDVNLRISTPDVFYEDEYLESIRKLVKLKINVIYPGHGPPLIENPEKIIKDTINSFEKIKKNNAHL